MTRTEKRLIAAATLIEDGATITNRKEAKVAQALLEIFPATTIFFEKFTEKMWSCRFQVVPFGADCVAARDHETLTAFESHFGLV